jgi:transcription-repair coupling factor (superfamily II helicase)
VGRSHRSSFAYFLIREETQLTAEASKRLQVIQSCTALGSGFNVATHDLEIRGSGNLLGEEQSGIITEVGMELYSQMLQETLAELKNEGISEPLPELNSGYTAYIPESYIPDASLRISTYRRLDRAKSPSHLTKLEEEILDRFGMYPKEVETLCEILRIRALAHPLKPQTLDCFPGRLTLTLSPKTPLEPLKILSLVGKEVTLDPKGRLTFSYESALQNSALAKDARYHNRPEFYDFSVCRKFLLDLLKRANISVDNL